MLKILLSVLALGLSVPLMGAPERQPVRVELQLVPYAEMKDGHREWVIVLGGLAYRSLDELKKAVARLPQGSNISWNPGCILIGGEPLHSNTALTDFRQHCESHGIALQIVPAG